MAVAGRRDADLQWLLAALLGHYGPQHWWPARTRLEMMAGAVLTQRTQWSVAAAAVGRLRRARLLTWPRFAEAGRVRLAALIRPCGDHRSKARRLAALGRYLGRCGGPARLAGLATGALRQQLLEVPGIGPETADAILAYAYGRPVFVADAYAIRLLTRLGWLDRHGIADRYADVHQWVTDGLAGRGNALAELHALIVAHGKQRCRRRPCCNGCPLARRCAEARRPAPGRTPTGNRKRGR